MCHRCVTQLIIKLDAAKLFVSLALSYLRLAHSFLKLIVQVSVMYMSVCMYRASQGKRMRTISNRTGLRKFFACKKRKSAWAFRCKTQTVFLYKSARCTNVQTYISRLSAYTRQHSFRYKTQDMHSHKSTQRIQTDFETCTPTNTTQQTRILTCYVTSIMVSSLLYSSQLLQPLV
jgi:hypothetical protein